jgi:hypothetical protein
MSTCFGFLPNEYSVLELMFNVSINSSSLYTLKKIENMVLKAWHRKRVDHQVIEVIQWASPVSMRKCSGQPFSLLAALFMV